MAADLVSLADASALLGVSAERVRQLVVAGDLPGVRFGNAWAVPRESIMARRQHSNRRGRPLSARRAWEAIAVGDVDLSNISRFRNRGEVRRYEMSSSDLEFLSSHESALVSGVAAAIALGEMLSLETGSADLYLPSPLHAELGSILAAVPSPLGGIAVRVVPDEVWEFVNGLAAEGDEGHKHAPRAAVALDLMASNDPRHWKAAEHLIDSDA